MSRPKLTQAEIAAQHGSKLAAMAVKALTAKGFESTPGYCQRFFRQVRQAVHAHNYDAYDGATAEQSRKLWLGTPFAVAPEHGSVIGDVLYKKATPNQPDGHVGIRIAGNKVAENSTVHSGKFGGRGVRSLEDFGHYDLIVRIPESAKYDLTPGQ